MGGGFSSRVRRDDIDLVVTPCLVGLALRGIQAASGWLCVPIVTHREGRRTDTLPSPPVRDG